MSNVIDDREVLGVIDFDESELDETESKQLALARFLECQLDDVKPDHYSKSSFTAEGGDYWVLDDEQADQTARENILESLWAFNASFLAGHCELEEEDIKLIQSNEKCESNNVLFMRLIKDLDHFVEDAISADGRGHFIAQYDHEENDEVIDNVRYYIYRTN